MATPQTEFQLPKRGPSLESESTAATRGDSEARSKFPALARGDSFGSDSANSVGDVEVEDCGRGMSVQTNDDHLFDLRDAQVAFHAVHAALARQDPGALYGDGQAANIQRSLPPGLASPVGCTVLPSGDLGRSSDPVDPDGPAAATAPAKTLTKTLPKYLRMPTPECLTFPDCPVAPPRWSASLARVASNEPFPNDRGPEEDAPTPAARDFAESDKESSDEHRQASIVEQVKEMCEKEDASVEELEAIVRYCSDMAQVKRSAAAPPSQVPQAQDVNPMSHLLGGGLPGYPPFPLPGGVPPMPQMASPYGMMPWSPPYPLHWPYAPAAAPDQQQKKRKDQRRKGEQYEMDDLVRKALEETPEDKRTTIMLRNIPLNCSRDQVESLLNRHGYKGKYDLLYLPRDFDKRANFGYAFINFWEQEDAVRAKKEFHRFKNWGNQSQKIAVVDWAKIQGKERSLAHWKSSPVMHTEVDKQDQPMCYDRDGNQAEDLLRPDKEPRRPRAKKNHTNAAAKSEPQLAMPAYGGYPYPYGMPPPNPWAPYC